MILSICPSRNYSIIYLSYATYREEFVVDLCISIYLIYNHMIPFSSLYSNTYILIYVSYFTKKVN